MKPHAKITKYQSLDHRQQRLDDVLNYIANKKYEGFAELIRQTYVIAVRRVEQLESEEAQLLEAAAAAGQDLDVDEQFTIQPALSVPTDTSMQYVKVLTELNAMSSMESAGVALMSVLTEAAAMQLLTKARDKAQHAKLEKQAVNLEAKLHITKTERWKPTDEIFKVRCNISKQQAVFLLVGVDQLYPKQADRQTFVQTCPFACQSTFPSACSHVSLTNQKLPTLLCTTAFGSQHTLL